MLQKRPQAVAGTKLDIKGNGERLDRLALYCRDKGYDFFPVCAVTGEGIKKLVKYLGGRVEGIKKKNIL